MTLLIYGAGGHGLVVAEAAAASGWRVIGLMDDNLAPGQSIGAFTTLGGFAAAGPMHPRAAVHVAIGDNAARDRLLQELAAQGRRLATIIHPTAAISPTAKIGAGCYIGAQAAVNALATLEQGVIVNTGGIVEHHVKLGRAVHIAPGAIMTGASGAGDLTLIGAGAVVLPSIRVGNHAKVGAGAAVVREVPDGQTVVGVPAREL